MYFAKAAEQNITEGVYMHLNNMLVLNFQKMIQAYIKYWLTIFFI